MGSIFRFKRLLLLLSLPVMLVLGCRSAADVAEMDLEPDQYFQRAVDATDLNNYQLAMSYYQVFLERFPDDLERSIWASYEIAFLHHKMGDDKTALRLFEELTARYDNKPEGVEYPTGPLVLTQRVTANILADQAKEAGSRRRLFRRPQETETE